MNEAVWTRTYEVDSLVVNPQKRLGLVGLLEILQDIAWIHGARLGRGYDDLIAEGRIWVLARQKVVVDDWPQWGETLEIDTWARALDGLFALRDYRVRIGDRTVARGTASWLILDAAKRRPVRFTAETLGGLANLTPGFDLVPAKIPVDPDFRPIAGFDVRNSDLDVNGHVNNTRYAQWILDSIPIEAHRDHVVADYEVNFLQETGVGDRVTIESDAPGGTGPVDRLGFQGRREADGRPVFTARLTSRRWPADPVV
jgi:acyl-ACP thioesterase